MWATHGGAGGKLFNGMRSLLSKKRRIIQKHAEKLSSLLESFSFLLQK
jgi:hypothetical protein